MESMDVELKYNMTVWLKNYVVQDLKWKYIHEAIHARQFICIEQC